MNILSRFRHEPTEQEIIDRHKRVGDTPEMREFRAYREATGLGGEYKVSGSGRRIEHVCACTHTRDSHRPTGFDWPCSICDCQRFRPRSVLVMEPR